MKRKLLTVVGSTAFLVAGSNPARAASFLSIQVNGTTVTCDNTAAFTATNCGLGFVTLANSNVIQFTGSVDGVSFGSGPTVGVQLVGSSTPSASFSTDTKTTVSAAAAALVTVRFANNGFTTPAGSPLFVSASQSFDLLTGPAPITQSFTGFGDGGNSLVPGTGPGSVTPNCTLLAVSSCSSNGPQNTFVRTGAFALSGVEQFNMLGGDIVNASGRVTATATPEPGSLVLFASGLLALGGVVRKRRNQS